LRLSALYNEFGSNQLIITRPATARAASYHKVTDMVDKVSNVYVCYAEQTIKWKTDDAVEETDSGSSESDSDN